MAEPAKADRATFVIMCSDGRFRHGVANGGDDPAQLKKVNASNPKCSPHSLESYRHVRYRKDPDSGKKA